MALTGALAALHAEDYAITTFAGTPNSAGGADGTPGTFNGPYGIAIDAAKNLYVTDTVNNTVRKITPARVVSTLAGTAGTFGSTDATGSAARFNFPVGIAVDSAGNVYVTDAKNFTIRKITAAGVVTTYAGAAFQLGATDGPANSARFYLPYGVAVDTAGTVYVADGGNHTIRRISSSGEVSTLAGAAQQPGLADGSGGAARFNTPWGLALDASGNLYVADSGNNAIRRVTPAGAVTTVAGSSGVSGSTDGPVAVARFSQPRGVSVDGAGNIYVADFGNSVIRLISGGNVSSLAGSPGLVGGVDSVGAAARFYDPTGIVTDGTTIYVADTTNNLIRRGLPASAAVLPMIVVQPLDQEVSVGQAVTLRVVASGNGLTYQWLKNGFAIPGATSATHTIGSAQLDDVGSYTVRISAAGGGSVDSGPGNLSVTPVGSGPIMITARPLSQQVEPGQSVTFNVVATGSGLTYQWLKNGGTISGATNASYTISSAQAADAGTYTVRLTSGATTQTATAKLIVGNATGAGISITSQPVSRSVAAGQPVSFSVTASGTGPLAYQWFKNDAAIAGATSSTFSIASVQAGDAGNYRVRVTGPSGSVDSDTVTLSLSGSGAGPTARLVNLSILTNIASAGDFFTMGYVLGGSGTSGSKQILIRAAGPTLAAAPFLIGDAVADPKLELFVGQAKTGENDNWGGSGALSTAFSSVGAFPYVAANSLDAATVATIGAGDNSVRVSATGTGTGRVIAELYDTTPFAAMTSSTPRLVNVSVLKHLGTGLTAGFVVDGSGTKRVLVRAVGPTLSDPPFNVGGAVSDPRLTLFSSGQTVIGSNDNWGGTAELTTVFNQVGAFPLPAGSRDAALLATLQPGNYTVEVSGVGGTGVAIVEIYEVP